MSGEGTVLRRIQDVKSFGLSENCTGVEQMKNENITVSNKNDRRNHDHNTITVCITDTRKKT